MAAAEGGRQPLAITVLTEAELRSCVALDIEAVDAIEQAYSALAVGRVVMPPVLHMAIAEANGEVDVKTAYVPGLESFALKVSPGFFDNPKHGLPSLSGLMMLLSARTGRLEALLLDNGYLTDVRTAAAGAVAARHLAPEGARIAGIIGAGVQARLQLDALCLVRPIERAYVWSRSADKAEACAEDMLERLGIDAIAVGSIERLVLESDVVVTTTPAPAPLVVADWLHRGMHITAMGSDAAGKNELHPDVLARADVVVCDRRAQCERLGELHHALATHAVETVELGDVIRGASPGRRHREDVTVCDLTGTGVQDTAIALLAFQKARAQGLGAMIEN
jgi:ectoine utilization protein EutC